MGGKGIVRRSAFALGLTLGLGAVEARAQQTGAVGALTYAAQGWSDADRDTFYTTSQGSHLMPYAWFKALRRMDIDEPFAADKLQRYGYLAHESPRQSGRLAGRLRRRRAMRIGPART